MAAVGWRWVLVLAAVATLLNACKPLAVDDTVYVEYARHIADHPLDPYGFQLGGSASANAILAPPAMLYWLAGTMHLAGDRPFLWKLGLLPIVALFAVSLASLCRRFARGQELPLVIMVLFAPTILPCLNLMLDVPALALSLAGLALFLSACERRSFLLALAAGAIAALAMQTKYTAFVAPALFLLAGIWQRRPFLGVSAAALAAGLFVTWEALMAARYGDSHFLLAIKEREGPLLAKLRLVAPLIGLLGATASASIVLGLAALGASRRQVGLAAAGVLGMALVVAMVPVNHSILIAGAVAGRPVLTVHSLLFGVLGLTVCAITAMVLWHLLRRAPGGTFGGEGAFLACWLGLEVAAYFALSPYPAVRRILGVVLAGTLAAGCVAARTCLVPERRSLTWGATLVSVVLGLFCFGTDFEHYRVEKEAAGRAVDSLRERALGSTIWFEGFGAFEFYGARHGMKRLEPGSPRPRAGDWLVAFSRRGGAPVPPSHSALGAPEKTVRVDGFWPLGSQYQVGGSGLEPYQGPLVEVQLYRLAGSSLAPFAGK